MRLLTIGFVAAAGIAFAAPALAQDVYVGGRGGGVSVGVDTGRHYHGDRYRERVYTNGFARGEHCRTTIIRRDGMVKKIRRCS